MKKLSVVVIITFITIRLAFATEESFSNNYLQKRYWLFIKERLFDGKTPYVNSFQEDICINLDNATNPDSIIVINFCKELNRIFSNRKIYLNPSKTYKPNSILIRFNAYENPAHDASQFIYTSANINGNRITLWGHRGIYQNDIFTQYGHIRFNDTLSFSERKRYIEYTIVRSLCHFRGDPQDAYTFVDGAILSDFQFNPQNTYFSNIDKFLLSKLYSNNFQKEFRSFMVGNYSWLYYMNFTNGDLMRIVRYILSIAIGILILLLSYNSILNRKYSVKYFSYLFPGLLIINSAMLIVLFNSYLQNLNFLNESNLYQLGFLNIAVVLISTVLYFLERYFIKPEMKFSNQLVLKVFFLLMLCLIPLNFSFHTEELLMQGMIGLALAAGRATNLYFKEVNQSVIRKKDVELSRLKELKALAEIKSLHARINPHFLYNSLNSIAGLVHSNPVKAEKMALSLSDLFRYTINRNGEQYSSVREEAEMAKIYLEIEKIRFGQRMNFSIEMEKGCELVQIPKFIIQPLVENAIKHGISQIETQGEVHLKIHKMGDGIVITVADNGPAFPEGLVCGYGLQSLYDLLKLTYGDKADLNWQNTPRKMISVTIKQN